VTEPVAIVTGAAAGLGRAFAVALARHGYQVAGFDIADMSETAREVAVAGADLLDVCADVTDADSVAAAVYRVVKRFGALHIVVNNAGIYPTIPFAETALEDWHRVMRVNLDGPFLVTSAALPHLRAAGWGRVVNIASTVVFLGPPELVAYTASKAGVVGFTRALAAELGADNITVNAIAPGLVNTATAARTTGADGGFEKTRWLQCVQRIEQPEDLTSTLLYICDRRSGFLTGQTINVDGGSARH
jgi:NAD(P)-dependent dehydrogenase (short-subunit alcohol dehydrogenase family)